MRNHRKTCSQGSIPFSWEDSPGVSKSIHHVSLSRSPLTPARRSIAILPAAMAAVEDLTHDNEKKMMVKMKNSDNHNRSLPPPPPSSASTKLQRHERRSFSGKTATFGRRSGLEEDPFLAAYKECTKDRFRWWKLSNNESKSSPANPRKSIFNFGLFSSNSNRNNNNYSGSDCKGRSSNKFVFSCKNACDVEQGSLVARLANLPLVQDHNTLQRR
ncbi:hypothetical protein LINGRAHAP2_LOCUS30497 [Linum grandiflorum]